jgi:hypothetical protein
MPAAVLVLWALLGCSGPGLGGGGLLRCGSAALLGLGLGWAWRLGLGCCGKSQQEEYRNGRERVAKGAAGQKRRAGGRTRGRQPGGGAACVSGASGGVCSLQASHA